MTTVLGIDAAWTATQPSGVALVSSMAGVWRLIFAGASYRHLLICADEGVISTSRPSGSVAEPAALLAASGKIAGAPVDLVAVDMPLSREPIAARRVSDNLVSAAYGARHCSTHTPSAIRPGKISDDLRRGFEHCGYGRRCHLNLNWDAWETSALGIDLKAWPRPQLSTLRSPGCGERGFGMRSVVSGVGRRGYGQRIRQRRSAEGLPAIGSLASSAPVFASAHENSRRGCSDPCEIGVRRAV